MCFVSDQYEDTLALLNRFTMISFNKNWKISLIKVFMLFSFCYHISLTYIILSEFMIDVFIENNIPYISSFTVSIIEVNSVLLKVLFQLGTTLIGIHNICKVPDIVKQFCQSTGPDDIVTAKKIKFHSQLITIGYFAAITFWTLLSGMISLLFGLFFPFKLLCKIRLFGIDLAEASQALYCNISAFLISNLLFVFWYGAANMKFQTLLLNTKIIKFNEKCCRVDVIHIENPRFQDFVERQLLIFIKRHIEYRR